MAEQFGKSDGAVGNCSTFTVELEGQKITSEKKPIEIDVQADRSLGALPVQTLPTGQKQAMVTVTGVKGTLVATAVKSGAVNAVPPPPLPRPSLSSWSTRRSQPADSQLPAQRPGGQARFTPSHPRRRSRLAATMDHPPASTPITTRTTPTVNQPPWPKIIIATPIKPRPLAVMSRYKEPLRNSMSPP